MLALGERVRSSSTVRFTANMVMGAFSAMAAQ